MHAGEIAVERSGQHFGQGGFPVPGTSSSSTGLLHPYGHVHAQQKTAMQDGAFLHGCALLRFYFAQMTMLLLEG